MWTGLTLLTALVVFAIGVVPAQRYLAQRHDIAGRAQQLALLQRENTRLQASVDALRSDDEIVRIARSQYGLAFAGEETYAVLTPKARPTDVPPVWPFGD